ncbi:maleylpyruvate isomerase family mycothiol-dependent enzyme [Kitasatospora sp. NPDC002227]|uniref:maleylpyruvate isomerase family mycothiol-dependent enzyme n=1 Tax=Kitasatospora sp. NPDC002227 TaxID=3154773 RepID=UPI0033198B2D
MQTMEPLETVRHLAALRREGELFTAAIAVTAADAPVPTCPEWTLAELVRHTGTVHRWATAYLVHGHQGPVAPEGRPPTADAALLEWFREGHAGLVAALEQAPADLACWTFLDAPSPLAFWARRQAHETTIHRVDAESAAGLPVTPVDTAFAADGIAELTAGLLARPAFELRSETERTLLIRPTDGPTPWLVRIGPGPLQVTRESAEADLELTGTANELYLLLWNRLAEGAVKVTGDQSLLALWRESAQIRWR